MEREQKRRGELLARFRNLARSRAVTGALLGTQIVLGTLSMARRAEATCPSGGKQTDSNTQDYCASQDNSNCSFWPWLPHDYHWYVTEVLYQYANGALCWQCTNQTQENCCNSTFSNVVCQW